MIIDRLTNFFGFEPITLLDPDQAVARGAAVYHYLLTNVESDLTDDMKKTDGTAESSVVPKPESQPIAAAFKKQTTTLALNGAKVFSTTVCIWASEMESKMKLSQLVQSFLTFLR